MIDRKSSDGVVALKNAFFVYQRIPEQLRAMNEAVAEKDEEKFQRAIDKIKTTSAALNDAISQFPATQEFLQSKNLTNISELDEKGMRELEEYLTKMLDALR